MTVRSNYLQSPSSVNCHLSTVNFLQRPTTNGQRPTIHERYFPTIGTLLPTPNALLLTRMIGQNWFLLYSFVFTSFNTRFTRSSSIPLAIISFGPCLFSIYW